MTRIKAASRKPLRAATKGHAAPLKDQPIPAVGNTQPAMDPHIAALHAIRAQLASVYGDDFAAYSADARAHALALGFTFAAR
jgi:hypothetical protein